MSCPLLKRRRDSNWRTNKTTLEENVHAIFRFFYDSRNTYYVRTLTVSRYAHRHRVRSGTRYVIVGGLGPPCTDWTILLASLAHAFIEPLHEPSSLRTNIAVITNTFMLVNAFLSTLEALSSGKVLHWFMGLGKVDMLDGWW